MIGNIKISCDSIENIETSHYNSKMKLTVVNPAIEDIDDLLLDHIAEYLTKQDAEKLFNKLIESDEELLHSYLEQSGYILNKA